MGVLLEGKLPCIWCNSSDALHKYTDNWYCFSCGRSKEVKDKRKREREESANNIPLDEELVKPLPANSMNKDALVWLYNHHFTKELIDKYGLYWSENVIHVNQGGKEWDTGDRLILPYYYNKELKFYEARSFRHKIKYIAEPDKSLLFKTFTGKVGVCVIVEDMVSAMRVGECWPCVALRGTSINDNKLLQLRNSASKFIIWLDNDKAGIQAMGKLMNKLTWQSSVVYIRSSKDPKCYSNDEIEGKINAVLLNK